MFRTPVLILNTVQAAQDLMVKRSSTYSGRLYSVTYIELCVVLCARVSYCVFNCVFKFGLDVFHIVPAIRGSVPQTSEVDARGFSDEVVIAELPSHAAEGSKHSVGWSLKNSAFI